MKFGLADEQIGQIRGILAKYPVITEAVIFGSRAMGNFRENSDVDIAIKGEVTSSVVAYVKYALEEETYLPYFFDIIAYEQVDNEKLKEHIDKYGISFYRAGWKEYKLKDLANYITGKLNSNAAQPNGNYPFFTCSPETLRIDNYAFDTEALILAGNNAEGIFSLKYYSGKFNAYQRTYIITVIDRTKTDYKFLYYSLKTQLSNLETISHGTATKYLTLPILDNIPIIAPPLPEQRAIAGVLSSLDDMIDLLHRQNKTLEAMAETLWRKMFIEDAKPEWEKGKLCDICEKITKGTTPTTLKRNFVQNGINFIKVESIDDNGNFLPNKFAYIDEATNRILSRSNLQEYDVLYTIAGTIGRTAVVTKEILPANTNQAVCIIRLKYPNLFINYLSILLKTTQISNDFNSKIVHAVQPNLSLGMISKTEIIIPNERVLIKYNEKFNPIFLKIKHNISQIHTLINLRDTLLPKLMSGELKVKF